MEVLSAVRRFFLFDKFDMDFCPIFGLQWVEDIHPIFGLTKITKILRDCFIYYKI